MVKVIVSLGSNLGDRKSNLCEAIDCLKLNDIEVSEFYENPAIVPPGSPEDWNIDFINVVVEGNISDNVTPSQYFSYIKNVEIDIGRVERERWAPREIDIDILFWGNSVINNEFLVVPHAEFHNRDFAMKLTSEIAGDFVHPIFNLDIISLSKEKKCVD